MNKIAIISGISGQDGSYLAELLLSKGYIVHGIERKVAVEDSKNRNSRIHHILDKITLHVGDIQNYARMYEIISKVQPEEFYHLAAQSFVGSSFDDEFGTMDSNATGTLNILNCLRNIKPNCKFIFAGTSELFGKVQEIPQKETTPFYPRSPYGISKAVGFYFTRLYREAYNMFCCNMICFNHEGERRGLEFVTRKISRAVAEIRLGKRTELVLGNLEAKRDWGYFKDYCEAYYLALQQDSPDDFVIATGETHSIKEFLEIAFNYVGLNWKDYVKQDEQYMRPAEVDLLLGDASKAKRILGWEPKVKFEELVQIMVKNDLEQVKNQK
jgi:GDPmannose 4,6-dehydratase